jgi:hypothetical protein
VFVNWYACVPSSGVLDFVLFTTISRRSVTKYLWNDLSLLLIKYFSSYYFFLSMDSSLSEPEDRLTVQVMNNSYYGYIGLDGLNDDIDDDEEIKTEFHYDEYETVGNSLTLTETKGVISTAKSSFVSASSTGLDNLELASPRSKVS